MNGRYVMIAAISVIIMLLSTNISFAYSIQLASSEQHNYQTNKIEDYPNYTLGDWYFKPSNYNQLVQWYKELETQYPEYLKVFKANEMYNTGKVAGNYDLYYVRITNESLGFQKPEVLFLGSPHGDETVGTIGLYWFTDWLMRKAYTIEPCQSYTKDYLRWLVDNREIYIEISHNPYGFDEVQRYDAHGWDLNREADYDGPGSPTGGIWASVPGQTLVRFVNNHTIRVGCDFHGGIRLLIYPWASTYYGIDEESLITGKAYKNVPPDFYFFDAASLRLGDYMGDFGGDLNEDRIGTIQQMISYQVKGGLTPWAYASDIQKHPQQDTYVNDEIFGNYPGSGIFWVTPEMSYVKNPLEINFGNDTVNGYGAEVRRYVIHQTDLAQPYIRWLNLKDSNEIMVITGKSFDVSWQVNGSLVVDHTMLQWGKDQDPKEQYNWSSKDYNDYTGQPLGGTGWDQAMNGRINGVTYHEQLIFEEPGDYYLVSKAQVDQMYKDTIRPEVYGYSSYLRVIQERTNASYFETIDGTDGVEEIKGQNWWYSPIMHIIVRDNSAPEKPVITGSHSGDVLTNYSLSISIDDPEDDEMYVSIDWGDGKQIDWLGTYQSGDTITQTHQYNIKGNYVIKVKAKDIYDEESPYASFVVSMSKMKLGSFFILFEKLNFFIQKLLN